MRAKNVSQSLFKSQARRESEKNMNFLFKKKKEEEEEEDRKEIGNIF